VARADVRERWRGGETTTRTRTRARSRRRDVEKEDVREDDVERFTS
jgi:hypothetical protein